MRTAIIYSSRHGTTEKVAEMIAGRLGPLQDVTLVSLDKVKKPDIGGFDRIILGTSIHAGHTRKAIHKFTTETHYRDILGQKTIGLFVCCMEPSEEKRKEQLQQAFPEYLHACACAVSILGGEFLFEKMNALERMIVKKVCNVDRTTSEIDEKAVAEFAGKML